ncbi:hypothetical protein [Actinokineospora bangkokensis]|uniref:Uncharacterized protein n=1 Tax=Actinokineospora bangkokensis TaxID=1193682 RepID=A0A1Q9LR27_9PSEU|nr:hypothetical protein [Actinokineospora bangkokensis]OLR94496.1 hypothetical protein BJP25_12175 [Actinokineospora bangkokensis]
MSVTTRRAEREPSRGERVGKPPAGSGSAVDSTRRVVGLTGTSTTAGTATTGPVKPAATRWTRLCWPWGPRIDTTG